MDKGRTKSRKTGRKGQRIRQVKSRVHCRVKSRQGRLNITEDTVGKAGAEGEAAHRAEDITEQQKKKRIRGEQRAEDRAK